MDVKDLYNRITSDNKLKHILKELGMHHISDKGDYISCGMPNGNNTKSTIVYKNSFNVEAYTRNIEDKYGHKNLISLVMFIKKMYFLNALKWICDICGYDYYGKDYKKPEILSFLSNIRSMRKGHKEKEEEYQNKPLNENILNTYLSYCNTMFLKDGIDKHTQRMFNIGYDLETHRITIPIRDELGTLVGVKGRYAGQDPCDNKYIYLFRCNKSNMLFGIDKTYEHIVREGIVYVAESEKAVMQGWSNGIYNVVSIGGHMLSKQQVKRLTHLGVEVCLCYDDKADFTKDEDGNEIRDKNFYKKEKNKFIDSVRVTCILDRKNKILDYKESPFDKVEKFDELLKFKEVIIN